MEKERISKELLTGVEFCSKQLKIIKNQLKTYLNDNLNMKENSNNKNNDHSREKLKRKIQPKYVESVSNSDEEVHSNQRNTDKPYCDRKTSHSTSSDNSEASSDKSDDASYDPKGRKHARLSKKHFKTNDYKKRKSQRKSISDSDESYKFDSKKKSHSASSPNKLGRSMKEDTRRSAGRGRPRKSYVESNEEGSEISVEKESAVKKVDSKSKGRGRPKKSNAELNEIHTESTGNINEEQTSEKSKSSKGRGRPKKSNVIEKKEPEESENNEDNSEHRSSSGDKNDEKAPSDKDEKEERQSKGRGRPRKLMAEVEVSLTKLVNSEKDEDEPEAKKSRGRPRKITPEDAAIVVDSGVSEVPEVIEKAAIEEKSDNQELEVDQSITE